MGLQAAEAVPALTGVTGGDGIRHLQRLWCWLGVGVKGRPHRHRDIDPRSLGSQRALLFFILSWWYGLH